MGGSGTLVFIFILENFPDNIQNKSLESVQVTHIEHPAIEKCDPSVTNPLLQITSRELNVILVPSWMSHEHYSRLEMNNSVSSYEPSSEMAANQIVDGSTELKASESFENQKVDVLENLLDGNEIKMKENLLEFEKVVEGNMQERMVAIFESLANVTAQTCGGTLVAPRWVLTAASCVNLLSNLADSSTNATEESVYTIIVNSTDPITDGTAHNVTEIHLHHQPDTSLDVTFHEGEDEVLKHMDVNPRPDLALLKINPPVMVEKIKINSNIEAGMHATVHGWAVMKNETGHDTMRAAQFPARILSPLECAVYYNVSESAGELCLSTSAENKQLVTQISWGGPVTHDGALVAVARADGLASLAAWPLTSHSDWIAGLINGANDN